MPYVHPIRLKFTSRGSLECTHVIPSSLCTSLGTLSVCTHVHAVLIHTSAGSEYVNMEIILENAPFLVEKMYENCNLRDDEFIAALLDLIDLDISINFDSKVFYMTSNLTHPCRFNIEDAPRAILCFIRRLITDKEMDENIKNKQYLIHFRDYVHKNELNASSDTIHCTLMLASAQRLSNATPLLNRLVQLLYDTHHALTQVHEDDEKVLLLKKIRRIENVLSFFREHIPH